MQDPLARSQSAVFVRRALRGREWYSVVKAAGGVKETDRPLCTYRFERICIDSFFFSSVLLGGGKGGRPVGSNFVFPNQIKTSINCSITRENLRNIRERRWKMTDVLLIRINIDGWCFFMYLLLRR